MLIYVQWSWTSLRPAFVFGINRCPVYAGLIDKDFLHWNFSLYRIRFRKVSLNSQTCIKREGLSWSGSYGSWSYNYLCNQYLSPLMLWVQISIRARCTTTCDKVCQWLVTGLWFSPGPLVSTTNKTDCHDITEILLKVVLNTIKKTKQTKLF